MINIENLTRDERKELYYELREEFVDRAFENVEFNLEDTNDVGREGYFLLNTGNAENIQAIENLLAFYGNVEFDYSILAVGNNAMMNYKCIPNYTDMSKEEKEQAQLSAAFLVEYEGISGHVNNCAVWRSNVEKSKITWSEHPDTRKVLEKISNKWDGKINGILYKGQKHFAWMLKTIINHSLREQKKIMEGEIFNITIEGKETMVKIYTYGVNEDWPF